jgi:hypothetical protein
MFRRSDSLGEGTYLVDTQTGEAIYWLMDPGNSIGFGSPGTHCLLTDRGLVIHWIGSEPPGVRYLLTDRGFVIVGEDFEVESFRAWRLRQVLLGPVMDEGRLRSVPTEFTNLDTGETHVVACPIGKPVERPELEPIPSPGNSRVSGTSRRGR